MKNGEMNYKKPLSDKLRDSSISYLLHRKYSILLVILIAIFGFNVLHIFADVLWQDDGSWYYLATEGDVVQARRARLTWLTPLRDYFYAYGMLNWGLPMTRSAFVLIMSLSSISFYFIYSRIFGINSRLALPAAVIPNILPSLIGIPMSLNSSYAMFGLLPILISIQLMHLAFTKSDRQIYFYWFLGILAYAVGLKSTASATFLIPSVLLFFAVFLLDGRNKIRYLIFVLPFLLLGFWQLYLQFQFTHRVPTHIPFDVILNRALQFLKMSSLFPINSYFSVFLTLFLVLAGLRGMLAGGSQLIAKPLHFGCSESRYRLILVTWPLVWIVCNSAAYIAASPTWRNSDYAYVSNFGFVLLQVFGIAYVWSWLTRKLGQEKIRDSGLVLILSGIVIITGVQKLIYVESEVLQSKLVKNSSILRHHLDTLDIPPNSQILVLNAETPHPGNLQENSGFMRYLLGRKDINALIRTDIFPYNIFAQSRRKADEKLIFKSERPILAFKMQGEYLIQKKLILQTQSTGSKSLPRIRWSLFDISQTNSLPVKIAGDLGMPSYATYLEHHLPYPFVPDDVVFAPGDNPEVFLDELKANEIAENTGLINSELNVGDIVTIRAVNQLPTDTGRMLELLVRVNRMPAKFKLGYRIKDGYPTPIYLWGAAIVEDNILVTIPITTDQELTGEVSIEFINMDAWPFSRVVVKDGRQSSVLTLSF